MQSGQSWTTTNYVVDEDASDEYGKIQKKIARLQKQLQAAEAKSALLGKTATMHVLAAEGKPEGPTFGLTVLANDAQ